MKEKRHLVMWVEVIALAMLLARLETVRIRENAKEVQEYTCAGRGQSCARRKSRWEIRRLEVLHIRPGPEQAWQEPEINMIRKRELEVLSHWLVQAQGIFIIREV